MRAIDTNVLVYAEIRSSRHHGVAAALLRELATMRTGRASLALLDGIRVVEMGVWVAGPAVGGVLADWGADVVKVEPPAEPPSE